MELDQLDRKILDAVQRNNRSTADSLSGAVGLSPTAVQRRLAKLRQAGVIESDVSILSPAAVGRPFLMLVQVTLERERADIIDRFKKSIRATPEIMSGYYVTGDSDFVLIISARNMEDYEAFTRRFFYQNADIKGFKTTVVMDRVKASFTLPVELD
jgi:Lrp/AsnC family leucine-responsive transcriptional regulator